MFELGKSQEKKEERITIRKGERSSNSTSLYYSDIRECYTYPLGCCNSFQSGLKGPGLLHPIALRFWVRCSAGAEGGRITLYI